MNEIYSRYDTLRGHGETSLRVYAKEGGQSASEGSCERKARRGGGKGVMRRLHAVGRCLRVKEVSVCLLLFWGAREGKAAREYSLYRRSGQLGDAVRSSVGRGRTRRPCPRRSSVCSSLYRRSTRNGGGGRGGSGSGGDGIGDGSIVQIVGRETPREGGGRRHCCDSHCVGVSEG